MIYSEILFISIFAIIVLILQPLRNMSSLREWLLIFLSWAFLATWGMYSLVVFLILISINYPFFFLVGDRRPAQRVYLFLIISINIAILCLVKYYNFFANSFGAPQKH